VLFRLALRVGVNVAAIFVASVFVDGVRYAHDWAVLVVAGLVFAAVNWLVRPVVVLLALPAVVLSLGVALFFVNVLMLYLTAWIVPHFRLASFGAACLATLVIWVVNVAFNWSARRARKATRW
jgi:putative membrane protein